MRIHVRVVPPDEFQSVSPVMDGVMQRAYGVSSFATQIQWYMALQPDGIVVAEHDGVIVGTGCSIAYPDAGFGWVGVIATDPPFERNGIGRLVTDRVSEVLAAHGCASVLDASLAGGPLYERMGFVDHGPTRVMSIDPVDSAQRPARRALGDLHPITAADLADVAAFDRAVFGADRSRLLTILCEAFVGRTAVLRDDGGHVIGFAIAQHSILGPLAAVDDDTIEALVGFAVTLAWSRSPQICVPPESEHLQTLVRLGWRTIRELRHMRAGVPALPGRTDRYAGRVSLGIG